MKSLVFASVVAALTALNLSPASAAQYAQASTSTPHYEWQYHYVGHHPQYRGGWVLVK